MSNGYRSGGGGGVRTQRREGPGGPTQVLFDPAKREVELLDTLAEQQARSLDQINSSQLRKFFGEVKNLYLRLETRVKSTGIDAEQEIYSSEIEPAFKMIRSKVMYAKRAGGQASIPESFADFVSHGVAKVSNAKEFRLFVNHFEAVVGFMYGNEKVRK